MFGACLFLAWQCNLPISYDHHLKLLSAIMLIDIWNSHRMTGSEHAFAFWNMASSCIVLMWLIAASATFKRVRFRLYQRENTRSTHFRSQLDEIFLPVRFNVSGSVVFYEKEVVSRERSGSGLETGYKLERNPEPPRNTESSASRQLQDSSCFLFWTALSLTHIYILICFKGAPKFLAAIVHTS